MIASIRFCKKRKPKKIIVAVPTAGRNAIQLVEKEADKVIVLEKPEFFRAVADSYEYWYDVTDKEAINIIKQRLKEEKFIKNRIVK